ncbi:MAG: HEAT repeat domain-containing protein [Gemmatimonadaceae bacterium]
MRTRSLVHAGAVAIAALSARLDAQSLGSRIAAAANGPVNFHFAARPGICGDGEHFIRTGRSSYHGSFHSGRPMEPCIFGPVQVRVTLENGVAHRVQYWVGPLRQREGTNLGAVSATEAARWLMSVAQRGSPSASAKAIMPAVLADSAVVWPALLEVAKDRDTRSRATRRDAMFWLSRFASGKVAGHDNDPLFEPDENASADEDVKMHAVFVLSQLPRQDGIPALLDLARTHPSWRVRSQAMFWLGQSADERALELFESVLKS